MQANCNDHKKFQKDLLIKSTSKLNLKNDFFAIFLVRTWFSRPIGAVAQNWLIPQKLHKNQNCRVSKSKLIMCLWYVALKVRKAGNRPRTFFTTLNIDCTTTIHIFLKSSDKTVIKRQGQKWDIATGRGSGAKFSLYRWTHCKKSYFKKIEKKILPPLQWKYPVWLCQRIKNHGCEKTVRYSHAI